MTFCVAAICEHEGVPAIMCISDCQSTLGGFVKTVDSLKFRYTGRGTVLMSGTVGKSEEFISMMTPIIEEYDDQEKPNKDFDLRISNLLEKFRELVRRRKRQLINHNLAMRHGITFEEFLLHGSEWYSPHTYATIQADIRAVRLDCDIIYTYVHDYEPIIVEITDDGEVIWQEHYSCIGSGSTIGLAVLAQGPWWNNISLTDCASRLCLAKWAAEKDPHVSEEAYLDISIKGREDIDNFSEDGYKYLYDNVARISAPTGLDNRAEFFTTDHSKDADPVLGRVPAPENTDDAEPKARIVTGEMAENDGASIIELAPQYQKSPKDGP
jgi:hypothetical protein